MPGSASFAAFASGGQCLQRRPGQPLHRPVAHRNSAQAAVEVERRRVPVEDRPLEAAAAALEREPREERHQRLAVAPAAVRRPDEEILQVQARLAEEGGEIVEEERKAGAAFPLVRQHHLGDVPPGEQILPQALFAGADLVRELLVHRELAHQLQDHRRVVRTPEAQLQGHAAIARMRRIRSLMEQPRRSAAPFSVTTTPASLRGVATGPDSFSTILDAGRTVSETPPGDWFAALTKSNAPPTAPT